MSSSDKGQRFAIGARVDATDGRCGHLTRVIIDPVAESLTHLVVEPGHRDERARLVPVDLIRAVEGDLIRLNCTRQGFGALDAAEDVQFLPADTVNLGYGDSASNWPYYGLGMPLHRPGTPGNTPMFIDRVPLGEVEVRRGDPVHASDGWIGTVEGLVIDPSDHHVTHVLLQEGHLWGRKQVAIPIGTAGRVADEIRVDLSQDEIEALPPVQLSSRR
jgi:sporulation protein YlmC with PRC-barrel domain